MTLPARPKEPGVMLWRTPRAKGLLAAYAAAAIVCAFLPLADHLGFEFAAILTIVAAIAAPFAGIGSMALENSAAPGDRRPARAAARAGAFAVVGLVLPAALILLNGLRRPVCDPVAGSIWLALLAAPTAWLSATLGALVSVVTRRQRWAIAIVAGVAVLSLIVTIASSYFGPAIFGFDHFWGYFPGPLYDESIPVSSALVSFRATTVLLGVIAVAAAGAIATPDRLARRMHAAWAVSLSAICLTISLGWGATLGWRTTDKSLRAALPGEVHADRLVLHFPRNWPDQLIEEFVRDATYDAAQIQTSLGLKSTDSIHVWIYRSAAEKRRLVGAHYTQFAKPYRREIHIDVGGFPHASLRHELVHAMAGELAGGLWGTPGGLIPNALLVEGFAVAYDLDDGTLTPAQEARAMRDLKIAPNLEHLLTAGGFLTESSTRAYTYAGAFVRFLAGRSSAEQMHQLYRTGDLGTLDEPRALVSAFERMLDTVAADASARSTAARRNSRPSIFRRVCAREVAIVRDSAFALASNRMGVRALEMFDRVCALQPGDASLVYDKLGVAIRIRPSNIALIRSIADTLWAHPNLDPSLEGSSRVLVGDELWRQQDTAGARVQYELASEIPVDPESRRAVRLRLRASADASLSRLVMPFLTDDAARFPMILRMADALASRPNDALLHHLVGRQWFLRGADEKAIELLGRAGALGLGDADMVRNNWSTLVVSSARLNRCDDAERARERLRGAGATSTQNAIAGDWVARCRFHVERGWKPFQ